MSETIGEFMRCLDGWEHEACILGNVRAGDLRAALASAQAELEAVRRDAERWRAFAQGASICTEGPDWYRGGYWYSGSLTDEPRGPREHAPTVAEYGDALLARLLKETSPS